MVSVLELGSVLGLSKERAKQLVDDYDKKNSSNDIDKENKTWRLGPKTVRFLLEERGRKFPQKKVLTFAALKGGIGKTTISTTVAIRAASLGARVLIVDLDPEACATNNLVPENTDFSKFLTMYDVLKGNKPSIKDGIIETKYPNLYLLPSALRNHQAEKLVLNHNPKKIIKDRLEDLDYNLILLELPPSFTTLTGSAYLAADLIVCPCTPDIFALESVALTIEAVDKLADEFECEEKNYKILINQYNPNRIASQDIIQSLMDSHKSRVLPFHIRSSADISNAMNAGFSIYQTNSSKHLREEFNDLTMFVCDNLGVSSNG